MRQVPVITYILAATVQIVVPSPARLILSLEFNEKITNPVSTYNKKKKQHLMTNQIQEHWVSATC